MAISNDHENCYAFHPCNLKSLVIVKTTKMAIGMKTMTLSNQKIFKSFLLLKKFNDDFKQKSKNLLMSKNTVTRAHFYFAKGLRLTLRHGQMLTHYIYRRTLRGLAERLGRARRQGKELLALSLPNVQHKYPL